MERRDDIRYIMITGGCGFIGFNFIQYIIQNFRGINIINIDKQTYAAKYLINQKLKYFNQHKNRIANYYYDINYRSALEALITKYSVEGIINFAAETHVDFSIEEPSKFIYSNVDGVFNLLELVRKYNLRFHQVSTDEVYGSVDVYRDNVDQKFNLNPSSPYSSSKASADMIVLSYFKTFNSKVTVSRTTNNYGPYQDPSKLIPKAISNFLNNQSIGVYGTGKNIRNWLYVLDHCIGIWNIYESKMYGEVFNIGSETLLTNNDLLKMILYKVKRPLTLIKYIQDRKGHDLGYHLNSQKIQRLLSWKEHIKFEDGLDYTIDFYQKHMKK